VAISIGVFSIATKCPKSKLVCLLYRMLRSADRSALPRFDAAEFLECMKKLISVDRDWVPDSKSSTLYIRPTMIGTEPALGVTQSNSALLYIITGPVGPYYPTGFKPVSLYADPSYVRSCVGGCGSFKMGANYGPTIYVQLDAIRNHNCQQVIHLESYKIFKSTSELSRG